MIHTEQLSADTIMFYVRGRLDSHVTKELGLSVLRSYHLGFSTFLCNLSRVTFLEAGATDQLGLIGEGLRDKGKIWRVIGSPASIGEQLILRTILQHLPREAWN
jgi:hypothetical protein